MSHSLLWRQIVLLTVCVYWSKHGVLYTIGISMAKRFQKSVGPFVTLTKLPTSLLVSVELTVVHISGERDWHPLQENEVIFSCRGNCERMYPLLYKNEANKFFYQFWQKSTEFKFIFCMTSAQWRWRTYGHIGWGNMSVNCAKSIAAHKL